MEDMLKKDAREGREMLGGIASRPLTMSERLTNRYAYHAPHGNQAERYNTVRTQILATANLIAALCPGSPEREKAFDALDMAMFNANAAIARNE